MVEKYDIDAKDALLRVRDTMRYDKDLTSEQLDRLKALNLQLSQYENKIKEQVKQLGACEVEMSFYLEEDHPSYKDEDDNILMIMSQDFSDKRDIYGIADGKNHNDFRGEAWRTNPMCDEYHCWTFHALYDHTELEWEELLLIGSIGVDIKMIVSDSFRVIYEN